MKFLIVLLMFCGLVFAQDDAIFREAERNRLENLERQRDLLRNAELQELLALRAEVIKLRTQYTEAHPAVRAAEARFREAEAAIQAASRGRGNPPELWWKDARYRTALNVSPDQEAKIDDVFQQYRIKLLDLNAALQKEEIALEPLIAANPLDDAKATAQVDRVAQARGELEKARGRMLLGMRKVLTADQWKKLTNFSSPSTSPSK